MIQLNRWDLREKSELQMQVSEHQPAGGLVKPWGRAGRVG